MMAFLQLIYFIFGHKSIPFTAQKLPKTISCSSYYYTAPVHNILSAYDYCNQSYRPMDTLVSLSNWTHGIPNTALIQQAISL